MIALAAISLDAASATQGDPPASGVAAAAFVSVASLVVVAIAAVLWVSRRPALSGALTAGYGAVSVGLVILDVGLLVSPIDANRLELFRPLTAAALEPGLGAYLLVAAHVLVAVGAVSGLIAINRASFDDGYGHSDWAERTGRASAVRIGTPMSLASGAAALIAAASMFAPPYQSSDSIVLVPAVIESPLATSIGSGIVALALLVVVAAALASISPWVASGAIFGGGIAMFGLNASRVIAGSVTGSGVEPSTGAWIGTFASAVLIVAGILVSPVSAVRDRSVGTAEVRRAELSDAGMMRWHVVAGVGGVLAGVLLCAGALLPVLAVPDGFPNPEILPTRVAVIAGFVLVVAAVPMFFSLLASTVRPALGVLTVAALMAAGGVLQSALLATDIDGISLGLGGVATAISAAVAVLCGAWVLIAGSAERDDVDTSDADAHGITGSVAWLGATVAAVGLMLPLYSGTDATAASILELPWGWDTWGQVALAATLLVCASVTARSRPSRATALLVGAVIAMFVYLLGWPLTKMRFLDPVVGAGLLVGMAGTVILAVAALLSARGQQK